MAEIERLVVVGWKDFSWDLLTVVYNFDISSSQQGHAKYALADSDYCGYGSVMP